MRLLLGSNTVVICFPKDFVIKNEVNVTQKHAMAGNQLKSPSDPINVVCDYTSPVQNTGWYGHYSGAKNISGAKGADDS
jgi:hypothetical protein